MDRLRVRLLGQGLREWHSVDPLATPTIAQLATALASAYNLPPVFLLLQNFLLPSHESIRLLRDDDVIRSQFITLWIDRLELQSEQPRVLKRIADESVDNEDPGRSARKKRKADKTGTAAELENGDERAGALAQSTDAVSTAVQATKDTGSTASSGAGKAKGTAAAAGAEAPAEAGDGTGGKRKRRRTSRRRRRNKAKEDASGQSEAEGEAEGEHDGGSGLEQQQQQEQEAEAETPAGRGAKARSRRARQSDGDAESRRQLRAQAAAEPQQNKSLIVAADYGAWPAFSGTPRKGQRVAFKVMELGPDYTPRISAYKEGTVVAVGPGGATLRVRLAAHCVAAAEPGDDEAAPGRFEMDLDDADAAQSAATDQLDLDVAALVDPRCAP